MVRQRLGELFGVDVRTLGVLRIGLAVLILLDLINRAGHLRTHYTDWGVLPRAALIESVLPQWRFSLHLMSGEAGFQTLLFIVAAVLAVALLVGYQTRLVTFLSWVMLASVQSRNPMVLQAGDAVLRMLLFWSIFLPLGARWSVDALRRSDSAIPGPRVVSAASVALMLQVVFIYEFTLILKNDPVWFEEFSAVYYALQIDQFVTPFGIFLRDFPGLLRLFTVATLVLELVAPILMFFPISNGPIRMVTIPIMIALHLGMGLSLEIGLFPYIMALCWLVFIPTWFWDRLAQWAGSKPLTPAPARDLSAARRRLRTGMNVLVAALLAYVFMWNLRSTDFDRYEPYFPRSSNHVAEALYLSQFWNMFAPYPLRADGWYVIPGKLVNGTEIDLFRGAGRVQWDKPELVSAMYPNSRWRKYMMNLRRRKYRSQRLQFGQHLCRRWNEDRTGDTRLHTFHIFYMKELTTLTGVEPVEKVLVWRHYCFDKPKAWDRE